MIQNTDEIFVPFSIEEKLITSCLIKLPILAAEISGECQSLKLKFGMNVLD